MKKLSIALLALTVVLVSCKKNPEVNTEYVDVKSELITVGVTTAAVQCDYQYITSLKKAFFHYGEGVDATNMISVEMRVVQNTLYVDLTGLKENTTYSYYYEFVNGFNSMQSATKTFKTEVSPITPPEITLPTVVTAEVTEITSNSAQCGGEVINDGGAEVTERGICWSVNTNPTLNDSHIASGTGTGAFTAMMNSLEANTIYHVRAYATNEKGTAYGLDREFTTALIIVVPTVTTAEISGISSNSAQCGGEVTNDGGAEVTERGICWSTNVNPTLNDSHIASGTGTGVFTAMMSSLEANTTYHVRAYATNEKGTAYGLDREFTTLSGGGSGEAPIGAINGLFTINDNGDKVYFSQGNLQYTISTQTWSFMEHQYDIEETENQYVGINYANQDIVSLFGWGTSGWNNGNVFYQPYDTDHLTDWNAYDFGYGYGPTDGTNYTYDLTDTYTFADWGVFNAIANGGNISNQWRALTATEWDYVFHDRTTNSGIRFAKGVVNSMEGVILLPDDWITSIIMLNYTNRPDAPFSTNVITLDDWGIMETHGAVFLPAAGIRSNTSVGYVGSAGYYWSASCLGQCSQSLQVYFYNGSLYGWDEKNRYFGCSVRLIQDANK